MRELLVDLGFRPWPHQRAAHAMLGLVRFIVLVWHRRAGKTVFAVAELVLAALACSKENGRYAYIAPLLKQAKTVAWDYLTRFGRLVPGAVINESELSVDFPNGAQVRLFGADNPDGLRGIYLDGVVLDEVADMKPKMWGEIVRPALTDRQGWAIFIGTPKGTNLFSELYYRAKTDESWGTDLKRAIDTGVLPEEEIEQARREMSPPQFAQEFECDFAAAAENVLIKLDDALQASRRVLHQSVYEGELKVLGIDVARFGDDSTVLALRQGPVLFKLRTFRGLDLMQIAGQCVRVITDNRPDAVFVDATGVGGGVVDRLNQLGYGVVGVNNGSKAMDSSTFVDRRAECWWRMASWLKAPNSCVPEDQELLSQLVAPTYWFESSNRLRLESKKDLKARGLPSPDRADALALTFADTVAPKSIRAMQGNNATCLSEYDPFATGERHG